MKIGSLFSGIGGLDLGFERAGFKVLWQVEKSSFCRRVLKRHWPDVRRERDVKECGSHNLTRVEGIIGGPPCQDVSDFGLRRGLAGERSGLWFEYLRIVRELRPQFIVVENVPGLVRRGLDQIVKGLAESGYDAEWDHISARSLGAPHVRDRVIIVAYPARIGRDQRPLVFTPAFQERAATMRGVGWAAEPGFRRVDDGIADQVDRLRGLGNAVVPAVAELIGHGVREAKL